MTASAASIIIIVVKNGGVYLPLAAAAGIACAVSAAAVIEGNSCLASARASASDIIIRAPAPETSAYSLIHK